MRHYMIIAAAALMATPASLNARDLPIDSTLAALGGSEDRQDEDDGNPRLGLLGLLGLAGLLGLMRREPDIHVDARRDAQDSKATDSSARP